jgi:hypothetical protein
MTAGSLMATGGKGIMNCICCGKQLSGGLDTYGELGQPMCFDCHWDLILEDELIVKEYEDERRRHHAWIVERFGKELGWTNADAPT